MKYVIIGLGIAGVTAAKTIRKEDKDAEIEIFTDEMSYYYPRPKLFKIINGTINEREIYFYPPSWYIKNNLNLHLGIRVGKIDKKEKRVYLSDGGTVSFDRLLLANGAHSFVPPIPGKDLNGVFSLRNLKDAVNIREYSDFVGKDSEAAVIGGGVLGLEMAHALKEKGLNPTVIEFAPHLLSRQLDEEGAAILKSELEKEGIKVKVSAKTESIEGKDKAEAVALSGGEKVPAKLVLISTGIRSNIDIAKNSDLPVNRGIIVDDYLHINGHEEIFASGDIAEYNGRVYGIIPPSMEQAVIAGKNMVKDGSEKYSGSITSNTLKVVGIELASIGDINPKDTEEFTIIRAKSDGKYRKVVLKNGKAAGVILLGLKGGESVAATKLVRNSTDLSQYVEKLKDINFSLKEIK